VQVDPIKPTLKAPGPKRLKIQCDILLSTSAFKFNLRRYTLAGSPAGASPLASPPVKRRNSSFFGGSPDVAAAPGVLPRGRNARASSGASISGPYAAAAAREARGSSQAGSLSGSGEGGDAEPGHDSDGEDSGRASHMLAPSGRGPGPALSCHHPTLYTLCLEP